MPGTGPWLQKSSSNLASVTKKTNQRNPEIAWTDSKLTAPLDRPLDRLVATSTIPSDRQKAPARACERYQLRLTPGRRSMRRTTASAALQSPRPAASEALAAPRSARSASRPPSRHAASKAPDPAAAHLSGAERPCARGNDLRMQVVDRHGDPSANAPQADSSFALTSSGTPWRAASSAAGLLPPPWAKSGFPPPRPPMRAAMAPTNSPARMREV